VALDLVSPTKIGELCDHSLIHQFSFLFVCFNVDYGGSSFFFSFRCV